MLAAGRHFVAKKAIPVDPVDKLIVSEVGPWTTEKHDRIRKYIDASSRARSKFLPPKGAGATYIELYSGAGRSLIRDTKTIIDGSPIVAFKAASASGARFSDLHLADLDARNSDAVVQRIDALGGAANTYVGPADVTVDAVVGAISPFGLHLAFLDPFGLGQLPFAIIAKMLRVRRMDMIIHVSLSDLQRNLDDYSQIGDRTLDNFAPGWRDAIDTKQAMAPLRAALIQYWLNLIRSLGTHPSTGIPLVVGEQNQRLYWLVFVSSNPLGHKLWDDVQNLTGQKSLF
jgi:three-Cys-motif partner protein